MKVICINNTIGFSCAPLTIGKAYDVLNIENYYTIRYSGIFYQLMGDNDVVKCYYKEWFITLEEYRDKKLEKLGI